MASMPLLLLLLFELLHRSGEVPPPILFLTCKFACEFLCIRNTYINSMSLKNFTEGYLKIEPVYFYCYSLLSLFLVMDVVAHAFFFKYYYKVKILIIRLLWWSQFWPIMKTLRSLFHSWEPNSECIELCLSLFSITVFPPEIVPFI